MEKDIKLKKKNLKVLKSTGKLTEDEYFIELMNLEDDEMLCRINNFDEELKETVIFDKNKHHDLMKTIGTMQRYNTEVAKAKRNRLKAQRYGDKIYNEKYEWLKRGNSQLQMKSQRDYDVLIGKDSRFTRTKSYCETYDILIKFLEEAIKQLNTKVFAIQSMIKSEQYDTGPNY